MLGVAAYVIWALGARRLSTALYNKDMMAVVNFKRESSLCGSPPIYLSNLNWVITWKMISISVRKPV